MKDSTMSHGQSKITKRSVLSPELAKVFLQAPYFETKPQTHNLEDYTNFFRWNEPKTQIEYAILKLLEVEQYDCSGKIIEYWFQHQVNGQRLEAHCDYNHLIRRGSVYQDSSWLHTVDKSLVMSPVTIGCYLKVGNTIGGELCISELDWFDNPEPMKVDVEFIKSHPYETFMPRDNDIVYFEGSRYFHWINPVIEGERKSMMINFWPGDMEV
jgi:hypothetical protein